MGLGGGMVHELEIFVRDFDDVEEAEPLKQLGCKTWGNRKSSTNDGISTDGIVTTITTTTADDGCES